MHRFKLFVSSPGDVMVERRRVENVVSRLNGEFAGVARLEAIRWETEFYQAFTTFQAQIPRSTDCDLVIGILKWRLGTELPPDFAEKLPGNQPFPSGTAYEILTAVGKRQKGDPLPDIYVFRFTGASPSVAIEDPDRGRVEHDWQALKIFFQQWFLTERGHFKAAFNPYSSEDDFETQLEKLLRKWVADKVASGRAVRWPINVKGSPFPGLAAFGAKHAPVFFGRRHDPARAVELWQEAERRGSPFLLVLGASGAGKSSLARAGLLPRLTTPGVVEGVDSWRIAVMRPSDSTAGPFAALAAALMQDEAHLPKEEEGRGPALPEIGEGDWRTPADLAAVLRHADAVAVKPIVNALARVGGQEREREHYGREVRCDLVLLIDQLEELFADPVGAAERAAFIALVAALVATGRIWVAATLRADFYARVLDEPTLKTLKEQGATYDLASPGPVELAEIVRGPAEAAGLVFETDAASGERLDARLLRDADRPDMLPLVQLALARLFEARDSFGGEIRLPLKAYDNVGGLKGIVNEAGEKALAALGDAAKAALPALLRQLAVPAHGQDAIAKATLTIRAVPLSAAAPNPAAQSLVDGLVQARLLTTSGAEADAQVRLTHQRVLDDWSRARAIVAESGEFYRIRAELEESRHKWDAGKRRKELLLPRGLPLAEAESIAGKYGDELTPDLLLFVRASRRRANRAQMMGWSAAAVFFLLAIGAGVAAKIAIDQKSLANRNLEAAKGTVDGLILNIVQGLSNVAGMKVDTTRKILGTVQKTVDQLAETAPDDPHLQRSRGIMFTEFADTYWTAGDLADAMAAATQGVDILRQLVTQYPGEQQRQRDLGTGLERLAAVKLVTGDPRGALVAYQEALDIDRKLAAAEPGNAQTQIDLSRDLANVGYAKEEGGDHPGALAAYEESIGISRMLLAENQDDAQAQRDLSLALIRLGDAKGETSDAAGALAAYRESLDIRRMLAKDQGNTLAQRDVTTSLDRLGTAKLQQGDADGALAAYQESLGIRRVLAAQDQSSAQAQRDVSIGLANVGDAELQHGDAKSALDAYQQSLDIRRKLAADAADAQAQTDLTDLLVQIAQVKAKAGDRPGALAAYQEALGVARKLAQNQAKSPVPHDVALAAAPDQANAPAQREVAVLLNKIGDLDFQGGDRTGALAAYQESLGIVRNLAARDQTSIRAQTDVAFTLTRLSLADPAQARATLTEALAILQKLDQQQELPPAQRPLLDFVRTALSNLP